MPRILMVGLLLLFGTAGRAECQSAVARGAYLVNSIMACGSCHSPRDSAGQPIAGLAFSGGITIATPAFTATASNITQDRATGIGTWSDTEIERILVEGVRPDHGRLAGVLLAAVMPANFYKALLPQDIDSIVAYLRTVPPIRHDVPEPVYKSAVRRDPYPDAEAGFTNADLSDPLRRGAYLVTIGHCMECHSAWSRGVSDFRTGLGAGGRSFPPSAAQIAAGNATPSIAANITADPKAGIGDWSDIEIKRAITQGIARDGHRLKPPMAYAFYANLTDADLEAIIVYLRTVPPRS